MGGLSVAAARAVLRALDDDRASLDGVLGVAHAAVPLRHPAATVASDVLAARADVDRFLAGLGWHLPAGSAPQTALADALVALRRLGQDVGPDVFAPYAALADRMAAREIASLPDGTNRAELVEAVVIGTVVFEAALVALRRLAEAHYSAQRFPAPT